ncbi:MAG TPA: GAF domain-containing protein [Burkholderiaceae bacterium]|nr:GAF domain-containing protein [Burkholderiaceae bacterium]
MNGGESLSLRDVRRMLEGIVPPALCTVSPEREPHVNYLSQAEYVDEQHIALSFQFFNRTRANVLATGRAALGVDDPYTGAGVVMQLEYLRTETGGPIFERMRAKLASIASQTGMENVFRLRGADIYRVLSLRRVPGRNELAAAEPRCDVAAGARAVSERLAGCVELGQLLDAAMQGLRELLRIDHAMLLLLDAQHHHFVTIASIGYEVSGIGAEIPVDEGLAGVAAREGVPIRVGHMTTMYAYGRAIRRSAIDQGMHDLVDPEIPLPGLSEPRSQLAVPLRARGRTIGVLLVESTHDQFFSYDDEDALTVLCGQLALSLLVLQQDERRPATRSSRGDIAAPRAEARAALPAGRPLRVRFFRRDGSVFLDHDYLIKGVAGAIFWKLANEFVHAGRSEFTNRELRLSPELRLPEIQDNLEVRLLLLQRRLAERGSAVRIHRLGRGRLRLQADRPLVLEEPALPDANATPRRGK